MGRGSISSGSFPRKSNFRQRCRRRCTHIDIAGAPQGVHLPDPDNFGAAALSQRSQGHRNGGVCIQGQVDPCDSALEQLLSKLLHSDDQIMVPKLCKFAGTRRTPYIHGIHTNQYYTRFYKKVNDFLLKNTLFLTPLWGAVLCRMSTGNSVSGIQENIPFPSLPGTLSGTCSCRSGASTRPGFYFTKTIFRRHRSVMFLRNIRKSRFFGGRVNAPPLR